jgi:hypothetical protein
MIIIMAMKEKEEKMMIQKAHQTPTHTAAVSLSVPVLIIAFR